MASEWYGRRALGHALRAERHADNGNVHAARLHYGRVVHYARQARAAGGALSVVHRAETVARAIKEAVEREVTAERLGTLAGLAVVGVTGALIVNSMREPGAASSYEELRESTKRSIKLARDEWQDGPEAPNEPKGTSAKALFPGLETLGNTCFMNAAIQCLVSVPALKSLFLSVARHGLERSCTSKVALEFVNLVRDMATGTSAISPDRLLGETRALASDKWNKAEPGTRLAIRAELTKSGLTGTELEKRLEAAVSARTPDLTKVGQQGDSHEFLTFLLDELACIPRVAALLTSEEDVTSKCPKCGGEGDPKRASFPILQLDVPNNGESLVSLAQCVDAYTQTTKADYKCGHCAANVIAERNHRFVTLSDVLVIHLKRFSSDRAANTARKVETSVAFEKELIVGGVPYALTGFVSHIGPSANNGHYTAVCRADGRWYTFDDETVTLHRPSFTDHYTGAYMLFYEKKAEK